MWQAGVFEVLTYLIYITTQLSGAIVISQFSNEEIKRQRRNTCPNGTAKEVESWDLNTRSLALESMFLS